MKNLTAVNAAGKICTELRTKNPNGIAVTTHDFQRAAMQKFQTEFALDFLIYIKEKDALQAFDLAFGKWLTDQLMGQATKTGRVKTANLRGQFSESQQWHITPKPAATAPRSGG